MRKILRPKTSWSLKLAPEMREPWRRMWSGRSACLCPPSLLPFGPSPQCGIAHQVLISLILFLFTAQQDILSFPTAAAASSPLPYCQSCLHQVQLCPAHPLGGTPGPTGWFSHSQLHLAPVCWSYSCALGQATRGPSQQFQ